MSATTKSKLIVLIITVVLIISSVLAWSLFFKNKTPQLQDLQTNENTEFSTEFNTDSSVNNNESQSEELAEIEQSNQANQAKQPLVKDNLILISGGTYSMGSPKKERQRQTDEVQHRVTVSSFYVDPYEVTQSSYKRVMNTNPSFTVGNNLPVENVTWYDAIEYCNKLSKMNGLTPVYTRTGNKVTWDRSANGYRLLTEAEWEYIARAGTTTIYNFGNQVHSDYVNFEGSYPYLIEENYVNHTNPDVVTGIVRGEPVDVNEFKPNAFGIYNTHGNVAEWCFDYYGNYDTQNTVNPAGATSGSLRINRGGSYNDFGKHLRSAYRSATNPIDADQNLGFRICRNAEKIEQTITTSYSLNVSMPNNPKILVAYFSYSGNTANAAKIIQAKTGADLFEITMQNPYNGNIYEVSQKDLMNDAYPKLAGHVQNMQQYDVILLGYPTWWATMPRPVFSFLKEYDFSGKTIFSFSSHGGTMFGDSVSDLSKALPKSYVGCAFEFNYSGGSTLENEISAWLKSNKIKEK